MAVRKNRPNRCLALVALLVTNSCGGTAKTERAELAPQGQTEVDRGGSPAECASEDEYDVEWVETWETGSGACYTNNDICEPCNDLETEIDTLGRMQSCFTAMQTAVTAFWWRLPQSWTVGVTLPKTTLPMS